MIMHKIEKIRRILSAKKKLTNFAEYASPIIKVDISTIALALRDARYKTKVRQKTMERYKKIIEVFKEYQDKNRIMNKYIKKLDNYWKHNGTK